MPTAILLAALAASSPEPGPAAAFPQADDVLARVRRSLPGAPVTVQGELLCGARRGKLDRAVYLDADLCLGRDAARASWTVRDRFGTPVERMSVVRTEDGRWKRDYARGPSLEAAPPPPGHTRLGESDVTWNDLNLAFLWWTGGRTARRDRFLERDCLVLEFAPPAAPRPTRLWIDEAMMALLKVEEDDDEGRLARRLTVRTFKKIGDTWLIKDMDVRSWPEGRRTLIRLTDARAADAGPTPPSE